jgi:hypothetical protein
LKVCVMGNGGGCGGVESVHNMNSHECKIFRVSFFNQVPVAPEGFRASNAQ